MKKKFKINPRFTPCPAEDDDEIYPNGVFVFNISKVMAHIQEYPDKFPVEEIAVRDYYRDYFCVDESHVDSVDVSRPEILAEIRPGMFTVIDGHHRMMKAHRMGVEKMYGYKVSPDTHMKFMIEKAGYEAFVEYWNSKLKG